MFCLRLAYGLATLLTYLLAAPVRSHGRSNLRRGLNRGPGQVILAPGLAAMALEWKCVLSRNQES